MNADKEFRKGNWWYNQGQLGWANRRWRKAADAGHAGAKFNLGISLYEEGKKREAEKLFREAADAGYVPAIANYGTVLANQKKMGEAESWWRAAAELGDTYAVICLWHLLSEQGREGEAEQWRRKAAEALREDDPRQPRAWHEGSGMQQGWFFGWKWEKSGGNLSAGRYAAEMGRKAADLADEVTRGNPGSGH